MNSVNHGPLKKKFDENIETEIENSPINPNDTNNEIYKNICILKWINISKLYKNKQQQIKLRQTIFGLCLENIEKRGTGKYSFILSRIDLCRYNAGFVVC